MKALQMDGKLQEHLTLLPAEVFHCTGCYYSIYNFNKLDTKQLLLQNTALIRLCDESSLRVCYKEVSMSTVTTTLLEELVYNRKH